MANDTQQQPEADTLTASRKFQFLIITAIMLLIPVGVGAAAMFVGKCDFNQWSDLTKWALGSLGITGSTAILGRALEGMAEKNATANPKTIAAGGDVTTKVSP